jgi:hypothetical protein
MPKLNKFIKMVDIELDDFKEDLLHLIAANKLRLKRKEISDYVFKGNDAILTDARNGLKNIQNYLKTIDTQNFHDLEELSNFLKDGIKNIFSDSATPKMDQTHLFRKIDKILLYLS